MDEETRGWKTDTSRISYGVAVLRSSHQPTGPARQLVDLVVEGARSGEVFQIDDEGTIVISMTASEMRKLADVLILAAERGARL